MELAELQDNFQKFLLDEENQLADQITETKKFNKDTRLGVYFNAYRLRLIDVLHKDFPKLEVLLGEDEFEKMAISYLMQCPSNHFSVRYFGARLSNFIATHKPYSEQPVFTEMAKFEWTLTSAIDSADAEPLPQDFLMTLAQEAWPELKFRFHPSLAVLSFDYNTPVLWRAIDEESPPIPVEKQAEPTVWRVWRKELQIMFNSMKNIEQIMLQDFQAGANFAEVCEHLCQFLPSEEVPQTAVSILANWIGDLLVVS